MAADYQQGVSRRPQSYDANFARGRSRTVSTRHAAFGLGTCIVVLWFLGALYTQHSVSLLAPFDLDGEWDVPALFSALLLVAAAALLLRVRDFFTRPVLVFVFASLLLYGAADEAVQIHENLERWLAVDWQRLYALAFLGVGVVWSVLLADLWRLRAARLLYMASGSAWVVSQVLEYFEWNGDEEGPHYTSMMVAEEVLEMTGTELLLLALLSIRNRDRDSPTSCQ
jgi:hypothetical protein